MDGCKAAVVIGASAGALEALSAILPALPANYPRAILIVVHLPPDRDNILVELLDNKCRIPVREAEDKEPIAAGTVYIAPPDYHLLVETDRRLSLSNEEPVHFSRPSIDVLFSTAAAAFRHDLIGIVLSGANQDGADGLRSVQAAGGRTLVQLPDTAASPEMPKAALSACPQARALSLAEIADLLASEATP